MMEHLEGLDAIAERLNFKRLGWHRHVNEETGDVALFPTVALHTADTPAQRQLEEKWQAKAMAQNEENERLERANRLAAKVEVNTLAERKAQITRGD